MSVIPLHGGGHAPDVIRERAVQLFQFLREYTLLRSRSIRTTDSYEEVIWLADVPQAPGCRCAATDPEAKDPISGSRSPNPTSSLHRRRLTSYGPG